MLRRPPRSTLFPTRRSSDLIAITPRAEANLGAVHLAEPRGGKVDRKSTRLNSSHMSISYAVFCLKKKNQVLTYDGKQPDTLHHIRHRRQPFVDRQTEQQGRQ